MRLYCVILPKPMLLAGTGGGHRKEFFYWALDTADALRDYWRENPEGLVPETVVEKEARYPKQCPNCGGTILPPTRTGVPRGTCRCFNKERT